MTIRFAVILLAIAAVQEVRGHGYLYEPPNRSSLWRFDFPTPKNYQDNQNFCGGFSVQWQINGGKCGACGDDYRQPEPRDNERHGKYDASIIPKHYWEGSNIQAIVYITASHLGYFKFHLCNMDNRPTETEECFEEYPLLTVDGKNRYQVTRDIDKANTYHKVYLRLPKGLTCERCVLRWHYNAGNSWGVCEDHSQALGCGPQETFRSCSDISIRPRS